MRINDPLPANNRTMKTISEVRTHLIASAQALVVLAALLATQAAAGVVVLQYGFDSTSGNVAVPITDDSGSGHDGTNLILSATAPTYSADIPANRQFTTGIGSIDFTGTAAAISTANSVGVGSGQGILNAAQVYAAGGLTMEVWVKNPADGIGGAFPAVALNMGGMYCLGLYGGRLGFFAGDNNALTNWNTPSFTTNTWYHLAVVMTTTDPNAKIYSNISFYLNGQLIGSAAHTFPWFLDRATAIGNHQYNDWDNYDGLVYEPRITLGALSPSQFTIIGGQLAQTPSLSIAAGSAAGNLVLTWAQTNAVLEWAPTPGGPWTPVAATGQPYWRWSNGVLVAASAWAGPYTPVPQPASPYTYTIDSSVAARFFHLRLHPPQSGDADYVTHNTSQDARHTQKVALIQSTNIYPLVLIGDSITQTIGELPGGHYDACTDVWNKHYAPRNALNLGYNGYRTQEILWNLENGELEFPVSPKVFRILIGCNNANDRSFSSVNTASEIMAGTKAIVDLIRQRHPASKILVVRILPRGGDNQINQVTASWNFAAFAYDMQTCNDAGFLTSLLADGQHVFWVDINSVLLQPGSVEPPWGQVPSWSVNTTLLWDLLHPSSPTGCEAWCEAIEPVLSQLMGDNPL